jgi:diaminohydroxyphosphoribosylaminopyrimidine deaminase/5-amino-6-(5-phosphoribosylamino)uracil reductase
VTDLPPLPPPTTSDERGLDLALRAAADGESVASPNPTVGAALIGPSGEVLAAAHTAPYGGPHAEVRALERAATAYGAEALRTATLYVTLEPCSHHGKTPPCAELIVERGIPRVVVGMRDPFPAVAGRGIRRLEAAGVEVLVGVREAACRRLHEAFVTRITEGRPLVTLKWAQTLDGAVATRGGSSQWISSVESRTLVHRWRAQADAVLVGAGTARHDDPTLTARHVPLPGGRQQPLRIVLDRQGTLPSSLRLFSDEHAGRTVTVVAEGTLPSYKDALAGEGGRLLEIPEVETGGARHLDLRALLAALAAGPADHRPVQSLLVEPGPGLTTAFVRQGLADRLCAFIAPKLIGDDGRRVVGPLGVELMADAHAFAESRWETVGSDVLLRAYRRTFSPTPSA